jgi:RNA polymerase sigma-70 factor, ECF subfamily
VPRRDSGGTSPGALRVAPRRGISEALVKTRLHRARAALRKELETNRSRVVLASSFSFHLSRCDRVVAAVFERIRMLQP